MYGINICRFPGYVGDDRLRSILRIRLDKCNFTRKYCIWNTRAFFFRKKTAASLAFAECADLKEVRIQGVKELPDGLFNVCSSLEKVNIEPGTVAIGKAFQSCESLKSIEIPDTVITLDGTFVNCSNLIS